MKKLVFLLLVCGSMATAAGAADREFQGWLEGLYPEAAAAGITRSTWNTAFSGVNEPDMQVLKKASYQPEFTTEIWDYLDARITPLAVERGVQAGREHSATLVAVEQRFGVEASVLLAIWSLESAYGAIFARPERLHYVPGALATLAYGDPKRQKFARSQLLAALKILQSGEVGREQLLGSWAGAMGHTQFIPTSYLAYGVDMDGNGRRDIWTSVPDALATAANLLNQNGWQSGKTWGYEVVLPAGGENYLDQSMPLAEWRAKGFRRVGGKGFPRPSDRAVLKLPAGRDGPAFLMLKNFFVTKRYNNADAYALAVGLLADRLAGGSGLVQSWPRPAGSLSGGEKILLQELLREKGYYDGVVDGLLGAQSRAAIRDFQEATGLPVDGRPTTELLDALR